MENRNEVFIELDQLIIDQTVSTEYLKMLLDTLKENQEDLHEQKGENAQDRAFLIAYEVDRTAERMEVLFNLTSDILRNVNDQTEQIFSLVAALQKEGSSHE